ncbi:MAG: hypothetical protein NTW48_10875 [Chloroflexi bacterium]|jgi:hypothetical protein|nr:hypothetical protein [Chloroflexota bacterium]
METGDLFDDKGRPIRVIESTDLALLKLLLDTPLSRLAIDSANRLRAIIDNPTLAVTQSGTWTVTQSGSWTLTAGGVFPVDQRYEMIQRANIEFAECQRERFTFS